MELRVLRYFLTVAQQGNITSAARLLHITQPTLSRQIRDLEEELGHPLFERNSHSISLTPEGLLLRRRAEEILDLVQKTEVELAQPDSVVAGDVYVGAGETIGAHFLTQAACILRKKYPDVHFHIFSGDGVDVCERLDKGLLDFGLLFDPVDQKKYSALRLPHQDVWGVLLRRDSPLSQKDAVSPEDLAGQPLIVSRQTLKRPFFLDWFGKNTEELNIVGTYNLIFNGSLMVEDGMGCAFSLAGLVNVSSPTGLCFRPLEPRVEANIYLVWKKHQVFSRAAEKYLEELRRLIVSLPSE